MEKQTPVIAILSIFVVAALLISGYTLFTLKKGDTGDIGPTGPVGAIGEQGPQGEKGDKGDTGDTGPQGPAGPKGSTGSTGPQGPQGEPGINGTDGQDYVTGEIPEINITNSSVDVEYLGFGFYKYIFTIEFIPTDADNDTLSIDLYYILDDEEGPLDYFGHYITENETITAEYSFKGFDDCHTLDWYIEVTDGPNIVWETEQLETCIII